MLRSKTQVYTVHIDPRKPKPYEDVRFVKEGFCLPAFLFAPAWALYHRLWWAAFAIITANLVIMQLGDNGTLTILGEAIVQLAVNAIIAFEANDWRRSKLARRGFIMTDIVTGDSLVRAEQRFYDHYFAHTPVAA